MSEGTPAASAVTPRELGKAASAAASSDTTPRAHATTAAQRAAWVDAAKGVGIVAVVIGHAIDGLSSARLIDAGSAWQGLWYWLYTFHMPLFFLLTGLFVEHRVTRDRAGFLAVSLPRLLWPYLLWSTVQLFVIALLAGVVNKPEPFTAARVAALLWAPVSQFWFLHCLFVLHVAAALVLPRLGRAALLAVALALLALPALWELPYAIAQPCRFAVFYALGVMLAALPPPQRDTQSLPALVAALLASLLLTAHAQAAQVPTWSVQSLPAALAGVAMVGLLCRQPWANRSRVLQAIGRHSMAIFLLHVFFVAGARIGLRRVAGVEDPQIILALATLAGVAGPMLLATAARRARLDGLLGLR